MEMAFIHEPHLYLFVACQTLLLYMPLGPSCPTWQSLDGVFSSESPSDEKDSGVAEP
ncbi:MAG: hypothetical protein WC749_03700 [Dehalococcoidia bacterium]